MTGERDNLRPSEAPAVVVADTGETLTHGEFEERTRRLITTLHEAGLGPGSVMAMLAPPGPDAMVVYAAARRAGLTFAALDHSRGLGELAYVVNDSGAAALFVDARLGVDTASLCRLTPGVRLRASLGNALPEHLEFERCLQASAYPGEGQPECFVLRYSDGTMARPVAVSVSRSNRRRGQLRSPVVAALAKTYEVTDATVLFSVTGLADPVAEQLYAAVLIAGGTVVTTSVNAPSDLLAALASSRATLAHLLPAQLEALMQVPSDERHAADLSALAAVIHSSAPCPLRAKQSLIRWLGPRVHECYGGAEHEVLTFIDGLAWLGHPGSVGRGVRGPAQARDADGRVLEPGDQGVVWFAADPEGRQWVTLGDVGVVDPEGYVYLVGRADAEQVVRLHPGVADAALVSNGADVRLTLVVQPRPGVAADRRLEREVIAMLAPVGLGRQVDVEFVGELPRTGSGRLIRRRLRASYDGAVSVAPVVPRARGSSQ